MNIESFVVRVFQGLFCLLNVNNILYDSYNEFCITGRLNGFCGIKLVLFSKAFRQAQIIVTQTEQNNLVRC